MLSLSAMDGSHARSSPASWRSMSSGSSVRNRMRPSKRTRSGRFSTLRSKRLWIIETFLPFVRWQALDTRCGRGRAARARSLVLELLDRAPELLRHARVAVAHRGLGSGQVRLARFGPAPEPEVRL